MRAGGCTVQQALTNEAANVVKQAVTLARRRGHAQVTPLHVANTMLSASTGLLRTACIQSHSHPLQCRALELCFNVALNRLPASSSSPMLGAAGHHSQYPSISNALVAAFKRAQAHQRRGSIENQQQPLLAVKIELEQLIISILDDPSVSRVMREAGFNSTQVKSNVEKAVSLEICSPSVNSIKPKETSNNNENSIVLCQSPTALALPPPKERNISDPIIIRNDDVMYVMENLLRKNFVIVGECVSSIEGLVRAVIEKVDKGDDVPVSLKDVKFLDFSFSSFGHLNRVEVEQKLEELKSHVRRCLGNGIVLNLGDLKWAIECRASSSEQGRGYYCPVEHMIMELGQLVSNIGEKFRIMGIATSQTYMRCKSGHPSLENVWGLHPLTIPAPSLRLSLITTDHHSDLQSQSTSKKVENGLREEKQLTCCADCSAKFQDEVRILQSNSDQSTTSSNLPPWFQPYKDNNIDNKRLFGTNDKDGAAASSVRELCKKWNSFCNSVHKQPYSSISPPSTPYCFSNHQQYPIHLQFSPYNYYTEPKQQQQQQLLSSNPNSASSSDHVMETTEYVHKFKELNAENLTTLCTALENKVPWQQHIIPEIVSTILKCRSGMVRRKRNYKFSDESKKEETWLFFHGVDVRAKEKIAKELARLVFGASKGNFVTIALSSFSSSTTKTDSTDEDMMCRNNKRSRDEQSYIERFAEAVSSNPHRVFFIEDVEQADYCSQMGFKRAIERGRISNNGEEAVLSDAIVILSCESFSSRSRACSPPTNQKPVEEEKVGGGAISTNPCVSLDLNISIDDEEQSSIDDIGLLESVDRRIIFKFQEL